MLYCVQPLLDYAWDINALVHKPKSVESLASAWHPQCVLLFGPGFFNRWLSKSENCCNFRGKRETFEFSLLFPWFVLVFPFFHSFSMCALFRFLRFLWFDLFSSFLFPAVFLSSAFHFPFMFLTLPCLDLDSLVFLFSVLASWFVIKVRKTMKNQLLKSGTKEQTAKLELLCWHSKFQFKAQFSSPWPVKMGKTQKQKSYQTRC